MLPLYNVSSQIRIIFRNKKVFNVFTRVKLAYCGIYDLGTVSFQKSIFPMQ